MGIFLTDDERSSFHACSGVSPCVDLYWALQLRVDAVTASPGLSSLDATVEWWHHAFEDITLAAMVYAVKPSETIRSWLRGTMLSVARLPIDAWVGPAFRSHSADPAGNLETAHVSAALAIAYDLAKDILTPEEQEEIRTALRDKGMALCRRWLDTSPVLYNWTCVLTMGFAVPACVLSMTSACDEAVRLFHACCEAFQPDGSYGESLQYGQYAAWALSMTAEALLRSGVQLTYDTLARYGKYVDYFSASVLCEKPVSGWGDTIRPVTANFGDSGCIIAPSGDLLLHIAARTEGDTAATAAYLFNRYHARQPQCIITDRSSFGFLPTYGFLTIPLIARMPAARTRRPADVAAFSNGDVIFRRGGSVLAIRGGDDGLNAVGHRHGDGNSFILMHDDEIMLADPGHSCYRSVLRDLDTASCMHNTCTYTCRKDGRTQTIEQRIDNSHRRRDVDVVGAPVTSGLRSLFVKDTGAIQITAADASARYGAPVTESVRIAALCGAHALFIIDYVEAALPLAVTSNWILNDRDGALQLKMLPPDRIVARRGNTGMKIFAPGCTMQIPVNGFLHDAYHTLPGHKGEGANGSAKVIRFTGAEAQAQWIVHAIACDTYGQTARWHLKTGDGVIALDNDAERWELRREENGYRISSNNDDGIQIMRSAGRWSVSS